MDTSEEPIREARRRLWQSLAERAASGEEDASLEGAPAEGMTRRTFLACMGASLALAGLGGCSRAPEETILPYTSQPPDVVPGVASFYATAMVLDGYATGILVESHEGHPTKVEGNPEHPASLGATSVFEQAHVLGLYEPGRKKSVMRRGLPDTWSSFEKAISALAAGDGRGLVFLLEPTTSPLLADQVARLRARLPGARFFFHSPVSPANAWEGARLAFGRPLDTILKLEGADVVLSLDADFLDRGPGRLVYARDFAARRRPKLGDAIPMNRLYLASARLSPTATMADMRLRIPSTRVPAIAAALLGELGRSSAGEGLPRGIAAAARERRAEDEPSRRFVEAALRDLVEHRGASVVVAGEGQPPVVHAIAHVLNAALGNAGKTVRYIESPILEAGQSSHDLGGLARALDAREVDTLVLVGGDPVYSAPADLELARRMTSAREIVYLGVFEDETSRLSTWSLPEAHGLESWGSARAFDGTLSLVQPLLAPLYEGRTPGEILALFLGEGSVSAYRLLQDDLRKAAGDPSFEALWEISLQRGLLAGSAFPSVAPKLQEGPLTAAVRAITAPPAGALEIRFPPHAAVYDGRFTSNAWLLELPEPVTKLTWDNAAEIAPATASRLGVQTGDVVELGLGGRAVRAPVLVAPGHAEDSVTLALGFGRAVSGVGRDVGVSAYRLRTSRELDAALGLTVAKTGERYELAITQRERRLEGREDDILIATTLDELRRNPRLAAPRNTSPEGLYLLSPGAPRQWGMAVDLAACTGCSACVVACQAENNVPVVGKAGVLKGREMHWLRIDAYFEGPAEDPRLLPEPMLCQHCEKAPCEYVCPVAATVHSSDGLNQMIYNRCVGTRFCSNNCPYKVRRFNWFNYHEDEPAVLSLAKNPDVTVRGRGVMEKCTYCVQRIRRADIRSKLSGEPITDGDVRTACQQACPTGAIVFGDIADRASAVTALHADDRTFAVLNELGTLPRTRYLARVANPPPERP